MYVYLSILNTHIYISFIITIFITETKMIKVDSIWLNLCIGIISESIDRCEDNIAGIRIVNKSVVENELLIRLEVWFRDESIVDIVPTLQKRVQDYMDEAKLGSFIFDLYRSHQVDSNATVPAA